MKENKLLIGSNLEWCANFESHVETLQIMNIVGEALTEKGKEEKKKLEKFISDNGPKYLELTS